ncbi:MAG: SAM-dependent methyltransferase [Buchnera aphidicola (Chaetogeoica yunlongensis)]
MSNRRSSSSTHWLNEHFKDPYVKKVHKYKIRSRAWFKLHEIQLSHGILKSGMTVIDLGASPGSWSEYAIKKVGKFGRVIAYDKLPMLSIKNVIFFQKDVQKKCFFNSLSVDLNYKKINLVMSDMAPNMTGNSFVDYYRAILLSRLALDISIKILLKDGSLLVKAFYGRDFNEFLQEIRVFFSNVKICKPNSSRNRSREVYILASGKKN